MFVVVYLRITNVSIGFLQSKNAYWGFRGRGFESRRSDQKLFTNAIVIVQRPLLLSPFLRLDPFQLCLESAVAAEVVGTQKRQRKLFFSTLIFQNTSNTPQFNRLCVQPKNAPDKPYDPRNTNSKNTLRDDSEPKNYLFYLGNEVIEHFNDSAFVVQGSLKTEVSQLQRCIQ